MVTHIPGSSCSRSAPLTPFGLCFISSLQANHDSLSHPPPTHTISKLSVGAFPRAVSAYCFCESLGHNSYQDKSQGSFLPSSLFSFLSPPALLSWLSWLVKTFHTEFIQTVCRYVTHQKSHPPCGVIILLSLLFLPFPAHLLADTDDAQS